MQHRKNISGGVIQLGLRSESTNNYSTGGVADRSAYRPAANNDSGSNSSSSNSERSDSSSEDEHDPDPTDPALRTLNNRMKHVVLDEGIEKGDIPVRLDKNADT
jgi:hypothetical protein